MNRAGITYIVVLLWLGLIAAALTGCGGPSIVANCGRHGGVQSVTAVDSFSNHALIVCRDGKVFGT